MSTKERILHMLLFEVIALALFVPLALLATDSGAGTLGILGITLSLIAMVWNYVYNLGFDHIFGHERIKRGLGMRVMHGICFELGLMIVTLPLIMWMLNYDFLTALILDIGAIVFYLVYAIVYNWAYDQIRYRYFQPAEA